MVHYYSGNVIDIEASSLTRNSYPIEIAVRLGDGTSHDSLIKPIDEWKDWSHQAQAVHGITRDELFLKGKNIIEVCQTLNNICEGQTFFSDGWTWDNMWLNRLFDASGISKNFDCLPMEYFMPESQIEKWPGLKHAVAQKRKLKAHRALNDVHIIGEAFDKLASAGEIKCTSEFINISQNLHKHVA
ncbi:hypothetical protein [Paraglaciecola sp. 2405UD69-4]|uniref:3'-5' exonuclease n=1 Tax=Paraglaciecola sp. 2405UD69-4 TaxID=3391836 RepID=UPI0039C9D3FA